MAVFALGISANPDLASPDLARAETPHSKHPTSSENVVYLTLQEALRRGAEAGPTVAVAAAPRRALDEAVRRANPVFNQVPVVQAQAGPRFSQGTIGPDVTVSLSQPVPLARTGPVQERLARAERNAAEKELELSALDAAERAGHAWVDLALSEKLLNLRQKAQKQAEENLKIVESRVRHGESDPSNLALAQSELALTRSRVLEAEGQHFLATSDLSYFTGLGEEIRAEVKAPNIDEPDALAASEEPESVDAHPSVQSAAAKALASKEAIFYAKAQQVPTVSFGIQYQREGTGDQVLSGLLTLPLPLWKPWNFQEARSRAQYDRQSAETRLVKRELERLVENARHERSHSAALYQLLETTLVPPKKEAVRLARIAFVAGATDYLRVSWVERELLAAEEQLAVALAEVERARLHYLRCTGQLRKHLR